ncbi:family 20 glycosylhydrolase [Pedobacter sp. SG918]|uniref:family 20 glycosylhydrolase n=1 Tax=Pedobacter sp. SG918 TaxID=2587136 RepID=UPI00146E8743|nr:family 20 glycosylhydrolase [Pedobacter sp. SG918]NMN37489.1 hexosaminidase [Pedobacter sp. SG918]
MKINNFSLVLGLALFFIAKSTFAQLSIVPQPESLKLLQGNFVFSASTTISANADSIFSIAIQEINLLKKDRANGAANRVLFTKDTNLKPEAYSLRIAPTQIIITVSDKLGAFWAVQTLKQLAAANAFKTNNTWTLPALEINDRPKFSWRGIHLDVSRHFFDIDYLHRFIDRLSFYKFNKFHWHLTDDQGWRIEIKKYPELTAKGAWRKLNNQDSACLKLATTNPDYNIPEKHFKMINGERMYGGFYTQEEIRELVSYATSKGVEIIPEIDMPGHMQAATKQFPWLTSTGSVQKEKSFTDPICPCKETTFEFAENIFKEIAHLFPSKYIHLGADEVEKSSWKNIPECEALMHKENLKNIDEIQSYFVKRMEKYFNSLGKELIGWDEILDGGVSPTATLMYWRTWIPTAPKHAAEKGNRLIMTPGEYCYFDAQQDSHSLKKVYGFNPVGFGLNENEQKYVLGGQANIWTEYIPSEQRLEYMVFPRMLAMSEVLWGHQQDFDRFSWKMGYQYEILGKLGINYRFADLKGFTDHNVFLTSTSLRIEMPQNTVVRYTTDGTEPKITSLRYNKSVYINKNLTIKAAIFGANGRMGDVFTINYVQSNYLNAVQLKNPKPGLAFSYFPKFYKSVNLISEADKTETATTPAIEIPVQNKAGSFATRHQGYFYAAEDGIYSFFLRSDDGSILKMQNKTLIDNDGMHFAIEKSAQIALKKGYHPFELLFLEGGGGYTLELEYSLNSGKRKAVSSTDFFME